jgi:signal transduction histidine kinase
LTLSKKLFYPKILLSTGIFLLAFTAIWAFIIVDEFEKLDENYYHYEEQIGENRLIAENGKLSEPFAHHNVHEIKVVNKNNDNMKITSRLIATNTDTGEVFLDEVRFYDVNAKTKAHQTIEKGFFVFPSHVEKKDYFLTFPLAFTQGVFSFVQETEIDGLSVYEFDCISEPYDITNAIPFFKNGIVKSIYNCKIWVEPITGKHVDFNLSWESFFEENGKLTTLVEKGNKKTTSEYVEKLVKEVKIISIISNIWHYFIPFIFLIIGITLIIFSYFKRTRELEKTLKQQEEQLKNEKLAIMGELASRFSHDIRNPLSNIQMAVDMIQKNKDIVSNLSVKEKFQIIAKNIDRISHQVNDVLDFVRIHPLEKKELSMLSCLSNSISDLNIPKNIKINLPKQDVTIYGDFNNLQIVCKNLIINAIQAIGKQEGNITVRFNEESKHTIIEVEDSGPGFPEGKISEIFEPLITTKQEGIGLGLVSCKSIIENHGGIITAKNNPTTFTIRLPKK